MPTLDEIVNSLRISGLNPDQTTYVRNVVHHVVTEIKKNPDFGSVGKKGSADFFTPAQCKQILNQLIINAGYLEETRHNFKLHGLTPQVIINALNIYESHD
jgi:hypothetical protein